MTDPLRALLHAAVPDVDTRLFLDPAALERQARRRRSAQRGAAITAVVLVVASVVGGAQLAAVDRGVRTEFAGAEPELGRVPNPGLNLPEGPPQTDAMPGPDIDLLARATTRLGDAALLGDEQDGRTCLTQAYLPPAFSHSRSTACLAPDEGPGALYQEDQVLLSGSGGGGAPGGIKDPALTYGAAPPGTRTIVLRRPGQQDVRLPARDGGDTYRHFAFFLGPWDLGVGPTTALALDVDGEELATSAFPYRPRPELVPQDPQCQILRSVTRSHFSRALTVGRNYAKDHPEAYDAERLSPPRSRANTAAGVRELFERSLPVARDMAPEERLDYRRAANVVLEEPTCWDDPAVANAARRFLDASGA